MNADVDLRALALLVVVFVAVASLLHALWLLWGVSWQRGQYLLRRLNELSARKTPGALDSPDRAWLMRWSRAWAATPWMRARRLARVEPQLADAIDLIVRALRAGHGLPHALRMVSEEAPQPLGYEFEKVCDQIRFGVPVDEALRSLAMRNPSDDIRCLVIAVVLQRETGGNLAEALGTIASLVRDRQRLRQRIKALSAEGRLSAWILGLLPFCLAGAIAVINPQLLATLWTDPAGRLVSGAALIMMVVGLIAMRFIIRVRV